MKRLILYSLLAIQVTGLVSLYAYYSTGRGLPGYMLECRPVDPRDFLRGDYVILSYDISRLPEGYEPENFPGGKAFVTLEASASFWKIGGVQSKKPDSSIPWLSVRVEGRRLVYGIEKYFVPEGMGNPAGPISAEIVIRDGGKAQIRQLYSGGQPWPPAKPE